MSTFDETREEFDEMRRRVQKMARYAAGLASGAMLAGLAAPAALADSGTAQSPPSLVALGDSIAYGYGLSANQSQPSPLAFPYLIGKAEGYSVTDLAVPGWTSGDLLQALSTSSSMDAAVSHATVVTVDIGSNDILGPAVKNGLLNPADPNPTVTAADEAQLLAGAAAFAKDLPQIVADVQKLAPKAKIVLYNLYDPIPASYKALHATAEQLIGMENTVILGTALEYGIPMVNAYGAFAGHQSQYILAGNVHPNAQGQAVLASLGEAALAPQTSPLQGKGAFVFELLSILGDKPVTGGVSPYVDVPADSPLWGWVQAALKLGIVQADSATTFGVGDPVTQAEAAQIAVTLLHPPLPAGSSAQEAALEWALKNGLFSTLSPNQPMTLAEETAFAIRLQELVSAQTAAVPASWHLSPNQSAALLGALEASRSPAYEQVAGQMTMEMAADLTKAGSADPQYRVLRSKLAHLTSLRLSGDMENMDGVAKALITITPKGALAAASQGTVREFLDGSRIYLNTGKGWSVVPGSAGLGNLLGSMGGLDTSNLTLSMFSRMTARNLTNGSYSFTGTLDGARLARFVQKLLPSLGSLTPAGQSSMSRGQIQHFMATLLQNVQGSVTFGVEPVDQGYVIGSEDMALHLRIPASALPAPSGADGASMRDLVKKLKDFRVMERLQLSLAYAVQPVATPSGLPN